MQMEVDSHVIDRGACAGAIGVEGRNVIARRSERPSRGTIFCAIQRAIDGHAGFPRKDRVPEAQSPPLPPSVAFSAAGACRNKQDGRIEGRRDSTGPSWGR